MKLGITGDSSSSNYSDYEIKNMAYNLSPPDFIHFCFSSRKYNRIIFNDKKFWAVKLQKDYCMFLKDFSSEQNSDKQTDEKNIKNTTLSGIIPIIKNKFVNIKLEKSKSYNSINSLMLTADSQTIYLQIYNKHLQLIENILPYEELSHLDNYYKAFLEIKNQTSTDSKIKYNKKEIKKIIKKYKVSENYIQKILEL